MRPRPSVYTHLLFDADGTLFDYEQAETNALRLAFADLRLPWQEDTLPRYQKINAEIWKLFEQGKISSKALRTERFARLLGKADAAPAERLSAAYLQQLSRQGALLEGAVSVIAALSQRYRIAILTNGLQDVQRPRLAASALKSLIPVRDLIISEEVGAAKPDAAIFEIALQRLGSPPKSAVLMIGDSLSSDMRGAANAGLDGCWYNPQAAPRPAEFSIAFEIGKLEQLLEWL